MKTVEYVPLATPTSIVNANPSRGSPPTGRMPSASAYWNRSNMYEYLTMNERSVRSGRSTRSYNPRVSV